MKRPFLILGCSTFFGTFFAFALIQKFYYILFILIIFAAVIFFKKINKSTLILSSITVIIVCAYSYITFYNIIDTGNKYNQRDIKISGYAYEFDETANGIFKYKFKIDNINSFKENAEINLYSNEEIILFTNCKMNVKTYSYDQKIGLSGNYDSNESNIIYTYDNQHILLKKLYDFKKSFEKVILLSGDNQTSSLIVGATTGNKSYIPQQTISDFSNCGASHILAISGLHLSLIILLIEKVLKKLRLNRFTILIILLISIIALMAFVGFSSSINRAGIMMIIYIIANLTYRKGDSLNSLGLSAFIILLINPQNVINISFLLSFCATLGIIILYPILEKRIKRKLKIHNKLLNILLEYFILSLSAIILTSPVTIIYFQKVSIIAPVVSIFISLFIPLIVVGGYIVGFLGLLFQNDFFIKFIGFIPNLFSYIIIKITSFFGSLPFANINLNNQSLLFLILSFVFLIAIYLIVKSKKISARFLIKVSLSFLIIFIISSMSISIYDYNNISVVDLCDNGKAYLIKYKKISMLIFDDLQNNENSIIFKSLKNEEIKTLNYVIITSSKTNNYNFSSDLMFREVELENLIAPVNFKSAENVKNYNKLSDYRIIIEDLIINVNNYCGASAIYFSNNNLNEMFITDDFDINRIDNSSRYNIHKLKGGK